MSKYSEIESGWALTSFQSVSRPPTVVPLPRAVKCTPRLISSTDGTNSYSLDISWLSPLNLQGQPEVWISSYFVEFRRGLKGSWGSRQEVTTLYARYENVGSGTFFARVAAVIFANKKASGWRVSGEGQITTVQAIADASAENYSYFTTEF